MKNSHQLLGMFFADLMLVVITGILLISLVSCGNSHRPGANPGFSSPSLQSTARILSIEKAIDDAKTYSVPSDSAVDPEVFETLKTEFIRQLEAESQNKNGKFTATAPTGEVGRVTDLQYNSETGILHWTYVNVGDYDCSGEVGVPDITPIALNYLAQVTANGSLVDWIDGDNSGEVGISDITQIAQGYLNTVTNYRIVTCSTETGTFVTLGNLVAFGEPGVYPKHFSKTLPAGALTYVAVQPVDGSGNLGEMSNIITISNSPPTITGVGPTGGVTGAQVQIIPEFDGTAPFTYNWNFGGGATPDSTTLAAPVIELGPSGNYDASVTISNLFGTDTYNFTLVITDTLIAPDITDVSPQNGVADTDATFSATVSGTPPMTYTWDFGGGAEPDNSSELSPTVTLGAIGSYNASLSVANAQGGDTYNFVLNISDTGTPPIINGVTPTSGAAGAEVQFTASVDGIPPLAYEWDFGGGTTQNTSSDASPTVTLAAAGTYSASLKVSNDFGSDEYNWNLTVGNPPAVTEVSPTEGSTNESVTFSATFTGDAPVTFSWDFGSGADPNTSSESNPQVTLSSSEGDFDARVTISNDFGSFDFPFTLTVNTPTSEGYTLFCPFTGNKNTYLIDMDGTIVNSWTSDYFAGACAKFKPNGNLLRLCDNNNSVFGGGKAGRIEERDWNDNIVWYYEFSTDEDCFHHDFAILPNGNILLNHWHIYSRDESIAEGRDPSKVSMTGVWTAQVLEIEPILPNGGNIVWQWDAFDHLVQDYDDTKLNYGDPAAHPELMDFNYVSFAGADWLHVNAVAYNEALDQVILSVNGISEIWIIDHSTTTSEAAGHTGGRYGKGGDILYRWGNPVVYRAGTSDDRQLFSQHNAHWIDKGLNGEDNILIFNNQPGAPTGESFSSIVEITPSINPDGSYYMTGNVFGPSEPYWIYMSTPKTLFFSSLMSSAQRLPGGNTLICSANQKWLFEVTPDGETIWEYYNPYPIDRPGTVFSALRYPCDFSGFDGNI